MKNVKFYMVLGSLIAVCTAFDSIASKDIDKNLLKDIRTSANSFDKSISTRNFKAAKEELLALYPLMKKEFKEAKKLIHSLEKDGNSSNAEKLRISLDRKLEIHDKLHGLAEASSASLRVQADDAKALVREYLGLLEEKQQLLSSLK